MQKLKVPDGTRYRILAPIETHYHEAFVGLRGPVMVRCKTPCIICETAKRYQLSFWGRVGFDLRKLWQKMKIWT